jgi:predicted Zn-dependent peptidase
MKNRNMKVYLVIAAIIVIFSSIAAQAQQSMPKPTPQPAKEFVFPEYKTAVLSNGIKVYLIRDDEQPTVSLRFVFAGGSNLDGQKTGLADLATSLMSKGAGKRNALEIAQNLDGIGADVSVATSQDAIIASGGSLTKHFDKMLEIFADVLLSPKFPKDEYEKLLDQAVAGVKMRKANSGQIASAMSAMATYGPDHPYAKQSTEKSLKSIEIGDIKDFYKSVIIPNNATLAVTGDFNEKDILKALESKFKNWKIGTLPKLDVPEPKPLDRGIYFIPRPGSKQSSIVVSGLTVPRGHKDYLAVRLTAAEMGGGFGSKLFRTLREKYSFTYSPFASATNNKFANRFACGAEVNSAKTDSSILIVVEQLHSLFNDGVTTEELERVKSNAIGNYEMNFENSGFVTSLIQMADFYGEPIEDVKSYPVRMQKLTTLDVAKVSEKYLKRDRLYIAVVGNPELKESLAKLGYNIYEYTLDLEDASLANAVNPVNMTPEELIKAYTEKIGGAEAVKGVQSLRVESKLNFSFQGQKAAGSSTNLIKYPSKEYQSVTTPMFSQKKWITDGKGWAENQMGFYEMKEDEFKKESESIGYPTLEITKIIEKGYKCKVLGEKDGLIKLEVKKPDDDDAVYYFDKKTLLISKIESTQESPQGPIQITFEFSSFEPYGTVKLPIIITQTTPFFIVESSNMFYVNEPIDDSKFIPEKANK